MKRMLVIVGVLCLLLTGCSTSSKTEKESFLKENLMNYKSAYYWKLISEHTVTNEEKTINNDVMEEYLFLDDDNIDGRMLFLKSESGNLTYQYGAYENNDGILTFTSYDGEDTHIFTRLQYDFSFILNHFFTFEIFENGYIEKEYVAISKEDFPLDISEVEKLYE